MARNKKTAIDKFMQPFARRLWQLMRETGTTQDSLAAAVTKTRQTVSQYVNGVSEPGYDTLVKISDYFQVSTDYLLGKTGTKSPDIDTQAITALTGLSEDNVSTLCQEQESVAGNADDLSDHLQRITYLDCINDILDALRCDSNNYAYSSYAFFREAANISFCYKKDFHNENEEKIEAMTQFCHACGYQVMPALFLTQFFATQIAEAIAQYLIDKYVPKEGD